MTIPGDKVWPAIGAFAVAAAVIMTPVVAHAAPADNTNSSGDNAGSSGDNAGASGNNAGTSGNNADSSGDNTDSSAVGNSAGAPVSRAKRGGGAAHPGANTVQDAGPPDAARGGPSGHTIPGPVFQNQLWWIGTPNPNPPPPAYTRTFEPLANLPGFSQPFYGWYRNLNFQACVLGFGHTITTSVGPYGTATNSVSTGGC